MTTYIFDEWKPNIFFLLAAILAFSFLVFNLTGLNALVHGLGYLSLLWAFSFSTKKVKR